METQIRGQMYGDQGRMESGMNWETGMNIHALLCIKEVTNENLLSTRNTTEYSGELNGKEIKTGRGVYNWVTLL